MRGKGEPARRFGSQHWKDGSSPGRVGWLGFFGRTGPAGLVPAVFSPPQTLGGGTGPQRCCVRGQLGCNETANPPHHGEKRTEACWGNTQQAFLAQSRGDASVPVLSSHSVDTLATPSAFQPWVSPVTLGSGFLSLRGRLSLGLRRSRLFRASRRTTARRNSLPGYPIGRGPKAGKACTERVSLPGGLVKGWLGLWVELFVGV